MPRLPIKQLLLILLINFLLISCGNIDTPQETNTDEDPIVIYQESSPDPTNNTTLQGITSTPVPSITFLPSASATYTTTPTWTPTASPTGTFTPTFTPIPTYVVLRGKVIVDQAVCHYGPGEPYLYKYGVYKDSNLEIINRESTQGIYVEVQAIGGTNSCWVKAEYLDIQGNINNLQPISAEDVKLPRSPYYSPLTGVSATRNDNEVTVSWNALVLRAGDDSLQTPYIVEAWVCRNNELLFEPVGSWNTAVTIIDEPDCSQPSHGRVIAAEKHGYTNWISVPWPSADQD